MAIPDDRQQFGRFEWERVLRRADLPLTTKGVGLLMATYAAEDGSHIWPGEERIAANASLSTRQVRTHLGRLRDDALLTVVQHGNQFTKKADQYVLTVPIDVAELNLMDTDELTRPHEPRKLASGASGARSEGDGERTGSSLQEDRKSSAAAPEVECTSPGSQLPATTSVPLMDQPNINHAVAALSTSGVGGEDDDEELTYSIASKEVQQRFGLEGAIERINKIRDRSGSEMTTTEATIALALAVREKRQEKAA